MFGVGTCSSVWSGIWSAWVTPGNRKKGGHESGTLIVRAFVVLETIILKGLGESYLYKRETPQFEIRETETVSFSKFLTQPSVPSSTHSALNAMYPPQIPRQCQGKCPEHLSWVGGAKFLITLCEEPISSQAVGTLLGLLLWFWGL